MKRSNRRWGLLLIIGTGTLHQGCFSFGGDSKGCDAALAEDAWSGWGCPAPQKPRPSRETDAEGRVGVTAKQAWPERAEEPPRLTADEVARGCAAFVACEPDLGELGVVAIGQATLLSICTDGAAVFSTGREERAIPWPGKNERFPFLIRAVNDARGDCSAIHSILTNAPDWLYCEEDGCVAEKSVEVTCEGDVAVFEDGSRRDCSRALAKCSTESETGCTDRPFTRCEEGAKARCDGDVKLGCDGCGFVSYRDCGWNGGHCEETADGAECVAPALGGCEGLQNGCVDGAFERCVFGTKVRVDCGALGMECASSRFPAPPPESPPIGICADEAMAAPCDLAFCRVKGGTGPSPDGGADAGSASDGGAEAEAP